MYKYKPVRYIFRLLNLIIYAAVISFLLLPFVMISALPIS